MPRDIARTGVVVSHGVNFPGLVIIGDPDSFLHRPTVVRLAAEPAPAR